VRFPGGRASALQQGTPPATEAPAGFLAQIISQEVQPEILDTPAIGSRHEEGIAAYETTLARTKTFSGPAFPIRKDM
jgi:hypothetical protein